MTTAAGALDALRARLTGAGTGISIPLRWQGEDGGPLPETPSAFAFIVFDNDGAGLGPVSFGGGRGDNIYRNSARLDAFVFTPFGEGIKAAMAHAETIAVRLRSFRDSDISCFAASVHPVGEGSGLTPPGLSSEVSNYSCAVAEVELTFDQVG